MARQHNNSRSKSTKSKTQRRRPIEEKLLKKFERYRRNKVVNISAMRDGKKMAAALQESVSSDETFKELHPAHAMYAFAQNQLSIMAEQLTLLDEPDRLTKVISKMEELHSPGGPPMSPITTSFFACWSLLDLSVGLAKETFTTLSIAIGRRYGTSNVLLELMQALQDSRMGIYQHEGAHNGIIVLRELVTDKVYHCYCASGYTGEAGQLWYVRLLPPPTQQFSEHIVFTTPYRLVAPDSDAWLAYFDRCLNAEGSIASRTDAYELHMKYGPSHDFWLEFVYEAYVNYQPGVIFLQGLPDRAESRPCSPINLDKSQSELLESLLNHD
jgi:hypothetical protein